MEAKPELKVIDDQWGSPTYATDIAEAIMHIIQSNNWLPGIYHFSNDGVTNWYEFAKEIKESIQSSCVVLPIPTEQYPTPARRPQYSILDKEKIKTKYNIQLVPWKKSLHKCLNKLVCL
jgi:dTDP-4-dehydrorhamnose reductase